MEDSATGAEGKTSVRGKFRNRGRLEIISNLLTIAKNGTLKTHLMYGANLSYLMVTEYLDIMLRSELIAEANGNDNTSKQYRTSDKGLKFLELYQTIKAMVGEQYLTGE
ncbi:MAG: winged helix-turn-helix domain-containing protein, partial [Thaumarchaeota archaeon]|nr:winged helix-turn-helix domain-containing protein [Nitrososphaerota archaeon]